jgi:hypothetical protein
MKRTLLLTVVAFVPSLASAATPHNFSELANLIVSLLDAGVGLMITAAIVIYLFGISRSIYNSGEKGNDALRTYATWGLGTIFLMVSIWGILQLLQNTLFGGTSYAPSGSISDALSNFL